MIAEGTIQGALGRHEVKDLQSKLVEHLERDGNGVCDRLPLGVHLAGFRARPVFLFCKKRAFFGEPKQPFLVMSEKVANAHCQVDSVQARDGVTEDVERRKRELIIRGATFGSSQNGVGEW